jgi:tol-pal system protein YbgF
MLEVPSIHGFSALNDKSNPLRSKSLTFREWFSTLECALCQKFIVCHSMEVIMDLSTDGRLKNTMKRFGLLFMFSSMFLIAGCGGSDETLEDEEGQNGLAEAPAQSSDQQALTSFIGAAPKETPAVKKEQPPPAPAVDYEKQLDELRAENTSVKQKIVKLEQDNRSLTARLSDTEAKLMAEKDRADRAVEAAKAVTTTTRGGQVTSTDTAPATAAPAKPVSVSMSAYNSGLEMFRKKDYDGTINTMKALVDGGISESLADNCHYWMGEAYYAKKQYSEAMKHFQKVFDFKNSEKKADAQFMIAQSHERMGNKPKAKEAYEKVVKDFPTSGKVQRAKERWARL